MFLLGDLYFDPWLTLAIGPCVGWVRGCPWVPNMSGFPFGPPPFGVSKYYQTNLMFAPIS